MSIIVRTAQLYSDDENIVKLLAKHLTPTYCRRRLEWLYCDNPEGLGRVWVAVDTSIGEIVGTFAAFPRRIYADNRERTAWVLGDFCLDPRYRSLGPALQLQRACLEEMKTKGGIFCYDFPSASMLAVYKRLGVAVTGKIVRMAKLLRVERKAREVFNLRVAHRAIATVGNAFLKFASTKIPVDPSVELSTHGEPCGKEFSDLADRQGSRLGISLKRSAEYLNWRYLKNPLASYEIITARRYGKLNGYAVWTQSGEDASVVDLFGENNPVIVKTLLSEVVTRLTNSDVTTVSLWLNEWHPWLTWCSEMGFRARDSVPMICIPGSALGNSVNVRSAKWFLMQGDRDS